MVEEIMSGVQAKDTEVTIKQGKNKDMAYIILLRKIGMKVCGKMENSMEMELFT